ncbi:hypothetical protein [Phenylobacterium sp.]|nr:hypothetical protein [Phenylobacterium sp.]MDP3869901.1 hypothetical protein [Phenylobacterium sp.]
MNHLAQGRARAINTFAMLRNRGAVVPATLYARLDCLGVDITVLEARYPA